MKALVYTGPLQLELREVATPVPGNGEVLVRVHSVGICGSDVLGYTGVTGRRIPPLIMGHEAAGVVAESGEGADACETGTRVCFDSTISCRRCPACDSGRTNRCPQKEVLGVSIPGMKRQGAMAEYVRLPVHALYPVPDSVPLDHAAMLEPLAIGLHAVNRSTIEPGMRVLIVGAGTIGLCVLQAVRLRAPGEVIIHDLNRHRLAIARKLGVHRAVIPKTDAPPVGADVTFEAVGLASTLDAAIGHTRTGGQVVVIGNATPHPCVDVQQIVAREVTLTGTYASSGEYRHALRYLVEGRLDPVSLISQVRGLEEGPSAFAELHSAADPTVLKVILRP